MIEKVNKYLSYKNSMLTLEGVSLANVKKNFSTPLYVYSISEIEDNYKLIKDSFKNIQPLICYAVKANHNKKIIDILAKQGAGTDVVSAGELKKSIANGIRPNKIVFSGVGKTDYEIRYALSKNIKQLNVESEEELNEIALIAKNLKKSVSICLRVNPNIDAKTHYKISTGKSEDKFGIPNQRIKDVFKKYSNHKFVNIIGLSIHIGSQIQNLTPFKKAFKKIKKQVEELRTLGFKINVLDLGGGIGIRYKQKDKIIRIKDYCKLIEDLFMDMKLEIIIEPGRFIVGSSGLLLSTIIRVKKGEQKLFLIIDAGMNNLIRPAMYNANHEIIPVIKKNIKKFKYDLVGPICETSDIFSKNILLQELKKEDSVVICSTGAYGSCMSSDYNLRGLAKEIFVKKNKVFEI